MNNKNTHIYNVFWTNDPSILYHNNKYINFVPTSEMTRIEQLNSLTRFCIYLLIFSIITKQSNFWVQISIIIIIFLVIIYYIFEYDNKINNYDNNNNNKKTEYMTVEKKTKPIIESGYYDSNNDLHIGKHKKIKYKKKTCKKPTVNNPFMNDTFDDLQTDNQPQPSNIDDDDIKDNINKLFNDGLYRDVSDLFERENSQRQFYTVPHMHPPDQSAFANWLYKNTAICKTNPNYCLKYEDLRYKR